MGLNKSWFIDREIKFASDEVSDRNRQLALLEKIQDDLDAGKLLPWEHEVWLTTVKPYLDMATQAPKLVSRTTRRLLSTCDILYAVRSNIASEAWSELYHWFEAHHPMCYDDSDEAPYFESQVSSVGLGLGLGCRPWSAWGL